MRRIEKILLIDDDEMTNFINKRLIMEVHEEDKIHRVLNGKEALSYITDNFTSMRLKDGTYPVLIFLDLQMPVMDGFEFLEALEDMEGYNSGNIPIVVLTSSAVETNQEVAGKYNIIEYVRKPLTLEKVESLLEVVV